MIQQPESIENQDSNGAKNISYGSTIKASNQ